MALTVGCLTLNTNLLLENMYIFIIKNANTESFPRYIVFLFLKLLIYQHYNSVSKKLWDQLQAIWKRLQFNSSFDIFHSQLLTFYSWNKTTIWTWYIFTKVFSIVCISMLPTFIHNTQNKNSNLYMGAVLEKLFL